MEGDCIFLCCFSVHKAFKSRKSSLDNLLPVLECGMCRSYTKGARTNVLLPFAFLFLSHKSALVCLK